MAQQTAMQALIAWGDEMLLKHQEKILSFAEVIDKAEELLQMEKEQMKDIYMQHVLRPFKFNFEEYYNETYGK